MYAQLPSMYILAGLHRILGHCGGIHTRISAERQLRRRSLSLMLSDMLICVTLSGLLTLKTILIFCTERETDKKEGPRAASIKAIETVLD